MSQEQQKKAQTAITPTREQDYPEWYQQVVKAADLAENSPVRGCMFIKPWGYGIWENIQKHLDQKFKDTGHVNAYFPLLIPLSFLQKEADHVEGFAKECAVVTHHRLETKDGKLIPAGELEEPFIIRPTSETIIGAAYAKWVQSYRDLPILINQWCNVMRWEMRTRLFLRTAEFLWQEGHTAHASKEEAIEETMKMLDVYSDFSENYLAVPVIKGEKTPEERFPGAIDTYTIEAMMQDRKALQNGTSHFLGQNFAKASEIQFSDKDGNISFAWTTSWGVSTRMIGSVIMTHSDDDGLVLPPRIAPKHAVIIPIYRNADEQEQVMKFCKDLKAKLSQIHYKDYGKIQVELDDRDMRGGDKAWQHIKRGVPLRLEVGPRDMQSNSVFMGRRDKAPKDKKGLPVDELLKTIPDILDDIHDNLFAKAKAFRDENMCEIKSWDEFKKYFTPKNEAKPEIHGGFAICHLDTSDAKVKEELKELKVTARCIPLDRTAKSGKCLLSGKTVAKEIIFAKSY